jgi:hypothetical protein
MGAHAVARDPAGGVGGAVEEHRDGWIYEEIGNRRRIVAYRDRKRVSRWMTEELLKVGSVNGERING